MGPWETSLVAGAVLGISSAWLVKVINMLYARREKRILLLLLRRARRDDPAPAVRFQGGP